MKAVTVSRGGFRFCRWAVAVLLWIALLLKSTEVLIAATAVLALNGLLGIGRAPLIVAYQATVDRLAPSGTEELYEQSMRFAHMLGTLMGGICIALILANQPQFGWTVLLWFAVFKTAGATGFCIVSKLFTFLLEQGDCCRYFCGRLKRPSEGEEHHRDA